ncbi:hypothetical protein [Sagittula sp. S175]|uniref:hypothetical protein n=1 Tax=Sagittula sp. S175 TaxID=3415129 RepID=UPI003C7C51A4
MIPLTRIRDKGAIISSFRGKTPVTRLLAMMKEVRGQVAEGQPPAPEIESKWSKAKAQLLLETHDKCAYCESNVTAVAFGDVEHYRPKSVYWWLAYVYDNYLASCSVCNQQFKSAQFEYTGQKMPDPVITADLSDDDLEALARTFAPDPLKAEAIAAFTALHRAEAPLIPNPYFDDPADLFAWEVFDGAQEVWVIPNPDNTRAPAVVDACERIYGLNRPQLLRRRYKQWRNYAFQVRVLSVDDAELRDMALDMLTTLTQADSEYTGMVRYFEARRALT